MFLKERHQQSEIVVRDLTSGAQTVIGWKNGKAFSGADFAGRSGFSAELIRVANATLHNILGAADIST